MMKWIKQIRVQLVDQEVQLVFASIGFERREPPKDDGDFIVPLRMKQEKMVAAAGSTH